MFGSTDERTHFWQPAGTLLVVVVACVAGAAVAGAAVVEAPPEVVAVGFVAPDLESFFDPQAPIAQTSDAATKRRAIRVDVVIAISPHGERAASSNPAGPKPGGQGST
jgi:hypothetical protein